MASKVGITYHRSIIESANEVRRFPVHLLESSLNLLLSLFLFWLLLKKILKGKLILVYLTTYPIIRFCDEFLRGDKIRGFVGLFSTSQFISLLILCVTVPFWIKIITEKIKVKKQLFLKFHFFLD